MLLNDLVGSRMEFNGNPLHHIKILIDRNGCLSQDARTIAMCRVGVLQEDAFRLLTPIKSMAYLSQLDQWSCFNKPIKKWTQIFSSWKSPKMKQFHLCLLNELCSVWAFPFAMRAYGSAFACLGQMYVCMRINWIPTQCSLFQLNETSNRTIQTANKSRDKFYCVLFMKRPKYTRKHMGTRVHAEAHRLTMLERVFKSSNW